MHQLSRHVLGFLLVAATGAGLLAGAGTPEAGSHFQWPPVTREARPWTRWWWLGSAVDRTNLTQLLETYQRAGLGGVEITPIYGIKGQEHRHLRYLSSEWTAMLAHACAEAKRLGMGVDLPPGSGWCMGGPQIPRELADATLELTAHPLAGGAPVKLKVSTNLKTAVVVAAVSALGDGIDVTDQVNASGELDWTPPPGPWKLYIAAQRFSGRSVKRPGPGGEGYAFNPYSMRSLEAALAPFDKLFQQFPPGAIRAQFHDSFEYAGNWTPELFDRFVARRGYDVRDYLPSLHRIANVRERPAAGLSEKDLRIAADYRATINELLLDNVISQWVEWCHRHSQLARNQAHGSPGNLLDLYAAADIPETEMFNRDRDPLIARFASSAAHVMGKRLTSSETGTWLAEHFTETLAETKQLCDELMLSGINHIIYHGTAYSPADAAWPGWLFYASSHYEPNNPIWRDFPALNAYLARCQSILQSGSPDNDLLLYWPFSDVIQSDTRALLPQLTIHGTGWFKEQPFGKTAQALVARGYGVDYLSDRQLAKAISAEGIIRTPGGRYRALVVPPCKTMPLESLQKLIALANEGATIIVQDHLPNEVPGFFRVASRRTELRALLAQATRVQVSDSTTLESTLTKAGVLRERLVDHAGLFFIRRAHAHGKHYFLANHRERELDGWIPLTASASTVVLMDPMTGTVGRAQLRSTNGTTEVRLQLQPGQSMVVRTFAASVTGPGWGYRNAAGSPVELSGSWQVRFVAGGPELPAAFTTTRLSSWTTRDDPQAQRFAGTALYTLDFDQPNRLGARALLDLGAVRDSAQVRLNDHDLGTCLGPSFRLVVDGLRPQGNRLEIAVTNVAANRIRDLDRRGVPWRIFHDINIVNRDYRPFDASQWPVREAGLLGPVTLTPLRP